MNDTTQVKIEREVAVELATIKKIAEGLENSESTILERVYAE